jgi:SNF2 family DNA or RNA helicase
MPKIVKTTLSPQSDKYAFQAEGISFLKQAKRAILGDEPGLGKSRQSLLAAEGRTLIVAPAAIHDAGVWAGEVERWRPDLEVVTASYHALCNRVGTGRQRKMQPVLAEVIKETHHESPFQTVIFDEAHYLKERKTMWTVAAKQLIKGAGAISPEKVFLLSGTPMPNWAHEIYVPLTFCRPDDMKGKGYLSSYWRWIETYFNTSQSLYGGPFSKDIGGLIGCTPICAVQKQCVHWRMFHEECFTYQGKQIFLQRLRDDVLTDLPPMTEQTLTLPMSTAQEKYYKDLKKDFIIWLKSQDDATFTVEAWNTAALFTKLMKASTGIDVASYPERPAGKTLSNKLDMLVDTVRDQARPSLVAAHFRATVFLAAERLQASGKRVAVLTGQTPAGKRQAVVQAFQAGSFDCLVATIDVIKEGLTLTAADTCHMLERSWRPSSNTQVIRRIHRIGQERPVTVYWYVSKGTHEIAQLATLKTKTDQQVRALTKPELLALLTD